jgi:hypothetical protein
MKKLNEKQQIRLAITVMFIFIVAFVIFMRWVLSIH